MACLTLAAIAGCIGSDGHQEPDEEGPRLVLVSPRTQGPHSEDGNSNVRHVSLDWDGSRVLFLSSSEIGGLETRIACPLHEGVSNKLSCGGAYLWEDGEVRMVSKAAGGGAPTGYTRQPRVHPHGETFIFMSDAMDLEGRSGETGLDFFAGAIDGATVQLGAHAEGYGRRDYDGSGRAEDCMFHCGVASTGWAPGSFLYDSWDGSLVAGDGNDVPDVFLEKLDGSIRRISEHPDGRDADGASTASGEPSISLDGRTVVFETTASDWDGPRPNACPGDPAWGGSWRHGPTCRDIAVWEEGRGVRLAVRALGGDPPEEGAWGPALSADGRRMAFSSTSQALVDEPFEGPQVFVADLRTGDIRIASVGPEGHQPGTGATMPSITADGRLVLIITDARLHPLDRDDADDAYIFDVDAGTHSIATEVQGVVTTPGRVVEARISADGSHVTFTTADRLLPDDRSPSEDAYLLRL